MKTILASIVALGFMTSAALACPGMEGHTKQAEKKDDTKDTKQAQAPKAEPKAPAPKAPTKPSEAPKTDGKVSQR
ncbi:MAG: hypothetical protein IPL61_11155 [Myxococcales bacterium]|nr:hypothetical protein [Myxococcales bacterium]